MRIPQICLIAYIWTHPSRYRTAVLRRAAVQIHVPAQRPRSSSASDFPSPRTSCIGCGVALSLYLMSIYIRIIMICIVASPA